MNDLIIQIEKDTRKVILEQVYLGNDHENLQEKLVFQFDTFVNGQARLEYEINDVKNYIILTKEGDTYTIPVQNVITIYQDDEEKAGKIQFQLVVTEGTEEENIPVFKSNIFYLRVRPSINAVDEAPEGYDLWIEQANAKLNAMDEGLAEIDNLDIDANKVGNITSIVITRKDGTQKTINVEDGVGLEYLWQGTSLGIKREDEQEYVFVNLKGDKGDTGEPGAIKFEIVQELPTEDIKTDTIYLVPYTIVTVQELPETGNLYTIYIVESTGKRYVYESSQWIEIGDNNKYIEYLYVNNEWEIMGAIGVQIDLTNYVKNTDYATSDKGGVIKGGWYNFSIDNLGHPFTSTKTYSGYQSDSNAIFINKGTLENVITGKGLVSNTDYATNTVGGVIKVNPSAGSDINSSGQLVGYTRTYAQYQTAYNDLFIAKGTLENVLTEKIGTIDTILETLTVGSGV